MKLHLNTPDGQNTISAHGPGFVMVNNTRHETAVIVMPGKLIAPWRLADPGAVGVDDFTELLALRPEVVIFGSGAAFRFPDPRIMAAFAEVRIGFDVMDTPAACRTYKVLAGEGRNVAAALLVAVT